jgi:hypothetical protein
MYISHLEQHSSCPMSIEPFLIGTPVCTDLVYQRVKKNSISG